MLRFIAKYVAAFRLLWITERVKGDFKILRVSETNGVTRILLPHNADTAAPGTQSLFWASRKGHALVEPAESVSEGRWFKVLRNFGKPPKSTKGAWLSGWLGELLEHFGSLKYENVQLPNGTLATRTSNSSTHWVIHVHGRKASIGETLRNFSLFDDLGFNQIAISHETDPKPLGLGAQRSFLGSREWKQVEDAVRYAQSEGATKVLLFGWSLGGMFVGQYLNRSNSQNAVVGAIFDSPMFDVRHTLRFQATLVGYNSQFADEVCDLIGSSRLLRIFGFPKLDFDSFSLSAKKLATNVPSLVMYSKNDGYVAYEDAETFSQLNENTYTVDFPGARHCRLKNSDSPKYDKAITEFVSTLQI